MSAGPAPFPRAVRGLRILFLAPQPFFEVRGTPLAVLAMVRALVAAGHHVELLTFAQGAAVEVPGLDHRRSLRLPVGHVRPGASLAKLVLDVPFMAQAAWRMLAGRFDVVHAVEEAAHLAAPLARILGLPLVVDVDSSIPDQLRESGFARRGPLQWTAAALERHALRHAAAVITVCTSLTEGVRTRAPGTAVFQVEDPPLVDATPPAAHEIDALRASLSLDARQVVLYSGNFEEYQGVDLLVDAAALVPEAQFVFMGGEPAEIERLRARAQAAGAGRSLPVRGQAPAGGAARLPRAGRRRGLAAPERRQHAFQGLHVPRLRAAPPGHADLQPHADPRRNQRVARGRDARRDRGRHTCRARAAGRGGAEGRPRAGPHRP